MGGSKGQSTQQTAQSQTYTPNQQAYGYLTDALSRAQQTANLPFNVPQAPVAGFSQDQQNAFQGVRNAQGMAQPYINQAQNYFSPQGAQAFYNPMADSVTSQLKNIFGQQDAQTTGQLTQAAGGVGADRIAVGQANLANQQGLAAGQTYANLYSQAVQQAQGAGYGTAALGSQAQNAALQGAQAQLGTGGLQQQLQQAQLNAPYQQQVAQAQFPYQQTQWYGNLVGGLAGGLGGTTQGTGNTTSTPAQPSIWSQILGGGLAAAGGLGQSGAFGSNGWLTGGNSSPWDSQSGWASGQLAANANNPAYGPGFAEGGEVSDQPIDIAAQPFISPGQMKPMQTHIPQLNLNPPQQSGGGGSGGGIGDVIGMAAKVLPFLARGGSVDSASMKTFDGHDPYTFFQSRFPKGYAEGGAPDGESVSNPFTGVLDRVGQGATRLATTPGAVMQPNPYPPGSEESSWYEDQRQKAMTDWSGDMSSAMTLGAGAVPAEAGALRSGMSVFPKGYLEKVPMDQKMSLKGVSHPGFRWQVVDGKTGAVMRKDIQTRGGASRSADRLDNKYGGYRYRAEPVAADEGALTEAEKQFLQEHEFDLGSQRARGGRTSFADGGSLEDRFDPTKEAIASGMFDPQGINSTTFAGSPAMADSSRGTAQTPSGPPASADTSVPLPEIITGKTQPTAATAMAFSPEDKSAPMQTGSTAAPDVVAPAPGHSHDRSGFMDSPWAALTAAGLGIMGGTSPFAGVNIGQGGQKGLAMLQQQRENALKDETTEQAARRLELEAKFHEDQFNRETIGQKNAREEADRPYEELTKAAAENLAHIKAHDALEATKPFKIGTDKNGFDIMGVRDPKNPGHFVNAITGEPIDPAQVPGATVPTSGGAGVNMPGKENLPDGIVRANAQMVENGPYDYSTDGPYIEKGMDVPEPEPTGSKSIDSIKSDAQFYLKTGKLPPVSRGKSPVAISQQHYRDSVQNYGNALARSRGLSPEQVADMWQSAPGMLRFVLGADGRSTVSLGTAVRHLDTMHQLADAWKANDIQTVNRIRATLSREFGASAATNLEAAGSIVGPEIIKAIGVAGAGTSEERAAARDALSAARTPEQLNGAIETTQKLLGGQLEGKRRQAAAAGVSEEKFKNLIGDRPYDILSNLEKQRNVTQGAPQTPGTPQVGEVRTNAHGVKGKWNGTGWEVIQ